MIFRADSGSCLGGGLIFFGLGGAQNSLGPKKHGNHKFQ